MSVAVFGVDGEVPVGEWPRVVPGDGVDVVDVGPNRFEVLAAELAELGRRCSAGGHGRAATTAAAFTAGGVVDSVDVGVVSDGGVGGLFGGLGDGELSAVVFELVALRERLSALAAAAGDVWARRRLWMLDGSRSAGHRLARDANVSVAAAKRLLAAGRAGVEMPVVAGSWADGRLSVEHVVLFAGARAGREVLFGRDEGYLVEQAERLRFAETKQLIAYWKLRADAELDPDGPAPLCTPEATVATTYDGVVHVAAMLDPLGGAQFAEALARIEHELVVADREAGRVRSKAERNAEALVEMAKRAHAVPAGARAPEPLVLILAGQDSFAHLCELSTGQVIHPGVVVPQLSRCDVQTLMFDGADRAVAVSSQRGFTGALRRVIQARDRHCTHRSGCDEPISRCDVDHVRPHAAGGPTSQHNGRLQCTTHNRHGRLHDAGPPPEAGTPHTHARLPAPDDDTTDGDDGDDGG